MKCPMKFDYYPDTDMLYIILQNWPSTSINPHD
jgi:uncharacterized protein YuzE